MPPRGGKGCEARSVRICFCANYCAGAAVRPPSEAGRNPETTPERRPATIKPTATYNERYKKCFTAIPLSWSELPADGEVSNADRAGRQEGSEQRISDRNHNQRREHGCTDYHQSGLAVVLREHGVAHFCFPFRVARRETRFGFQSAASERTDTVSGARFTRQEVGSTFT